MESSNFTPGLALHGLQCGMIAKVREGFATIRDQVWMNVALRANIERFVEKLNLNQFKNLKCMQGSRYL